MSVNNWDEIKNDYVTGKAPSLSKLAKKHGISEASAMRASAKGKWVKARANHRRDLAAEIVKAQLASTVSTKGEFDQRIHGLTDILLDSAELAVKEGTLTDNSRKVNAETVMKLVELKYRILGIPPPKTQSQIDEEGAYKHYLERLADARVSLEERIATGEVKVIKRSKGNGKGNGKLNPNDLVRIKIKRPG